MIWTENRENAYCEITPAIMALKEQWEKKNYIDPRLYKEYNVKRGLRDEDGRGVLTGLTRVGEIQSYSVTEGEHIIPQDGVLYYRGIDSRDLVTGSAGRGKTYAAKRFCLDNQDAVYVLYVDGFSQTMLIREICEALTGLRHRTFERCLMEIKQAASARRRLVIIDEADKMPVPFLEMLRALNEAAGLPLALVGEDRLHSKMAAIPRLRSRIRNPYISFNAIDPSEVMIYYQTAAGIDVDPSAVNYLWQKAKGDFRTIANDAFAAVEMMKANAMRKLTLEAARSLYE